MHSSQHPVVQQLWEKFERAIFRNQSKAVKEALPTSQLVRLHTGSGIFRGWAYEMKLPSGSSTQIACASVHPEVSLWFLCFYESVVFSVVTNRQIYKFTLPN